MNSYNYIRNTRPNAGKWPLTLLCLVFALSSCTKDFESYNTNPNALNDAQTLAKLSTAFGPIEQAIYSNYQTAQNLSADAYSGYMMSPTPFSANYNLNYALTDGWNVNGFKDPYTLVMAPIKKIAEAGTREKAPEMWGVALLLQVEAMDRVTDRFGPIPYTKAGSSLKSVDYDDQKTIYEAFFKQIDTALINLKAYVGANPGKSTLGDGDLIYNGNFNQWIKYANSMRLRLAMRISKVDPALAKQQGEIALADPDGLLTTPADDAKIAQSGGRQNDLWMITASWGDNRLGASFGTYLTGFKDPRIPQLAIPATDPKLGGKYTGIRVGIAIKAKADYEGYASLNTDGSSFNETSAQYIMTAAECWFLKAEAALRGWTGAGDIQKDYETGIQTSMDQWGVKIGNYLKDATSKQIAYVDPKNADNNSPALSTITIKWDGAASKEHQLEQIITQKWIAMFPDGQEAWADYRRTGYPKLFPVVHNNSGGTISTEIQIRRLPYPAIEYATDNGSAVKAAVADLLGGADNGGTRLWWDVAGPNF
ncbi:MAG TPA: SusD/RagB family nutrient-binding outer membrane lipoprotein [Arachidicoccus sp.]|nr:SusD/RagB family nutrient-binding outer membrane lipoprotein [Arachidicoccus sp.]